MSRTTTSVTYSTFPLTTTPFVASTIVTKTSNIIKDEKKTLNLTFQDYNTKSEKFKFENLPLVG